MEHIVQFGITIDDNAIINTIVQKAEKSILDEIKDAIKKAMFKRGRYYDETEVHTWIKDELDKFLENHKDDIISLASEKLADKLSRTKRVKDEVNKVLEVLSND